MGQMVSRTTLVIPIGQRKRKHSPALPPNVAKSHCCPAITAAWLSTTPFGFPDEPDVKKMNAAFRDGTEPSAWDTASAQRMACMSADSWSGEKPISDELPAAG